METNNKVIVAFDLYDTLLSTAFISQKLAGFIPRETAESLALLWRRYQLEYTWRLNSLGRFDLYHNITVNSLHHAARDLKVSFQQDQVDQLMKSYDSLSTFSDVAAALKKIHSSTNLIPVIFSNGQKSMVENSVVRSHDLGPQAAVFADIITVDVVKKYKPKPDVYQYLAKKVGKEPHQYKDIWLVSGNPFDITGSKNAGLNAAWVDRSGLGWRDGLISDGVPTVSSQKLDNLMAKIEEHVKQNAYETSSPLLDSSAGQEKERNLPAKVAIVGGGIAGLSTAYFLQNDTRLGNSTQITIFEREARIGGRIRTAKVYGTGSEVDTGGHTFDRDDDLINELAHAMYVSILKDRIIYFYDYVRMRRVEPSALDRACLWDGQTLTTNVAEEPPLDLPSLKRILKKYRLEPRFWMKFCHTLWQAATDENLRDSLEWFNYDLNTLIEMVVWAAAWARPGPNEADLRHFADTHSISLEPQSYARDGNMYLLSRLANHLSRDDSFSLKLGSTVTRIDRHQDFKVYWTEDTNSGLEDTRSERFDYVIIAAPSSQSAIDIHPAPSVVPQEVGYQHLHVTHFISRTALDRQTFNLPPETKVPLMIWNTGQSTGDHKSPAPPFISIVQESSDTCSGCVCSSEPIYRVISKEELSDSDIAILLRKNGKSRKEVTFPDQSCEKLTQEEGYGIGEEPPARPDKDEKVRLPGCVKHPDIRWIHREFWFNGMPIIQNKRVEQMELAPNLFYVSGFEGREGASISKSVRSARKASELLTEQFSQRLLR